MRAPWSWITEFVPVERSAEEVADRLSMRAIKVERVERAGGDITGVVVGSVVKMEEHPDADIFRAFPGAGDAMAPRLLAALGSDRQRLSDAQQVQQISGIAPVTRQSGKSRIVQRRWAASRFLRQTFHEFAAHSIKQSTWAKAYYDMMRARGNKHQAAVRALAFKWIRIIYRCWQNRTPYAPATHRAAQPFLAVAAADQAA